MAGLVVHAQEAQCVKVGAYLDPARKVRVHATMTRNGRTVFAWRVRGSKAPGITTRDATETVKTFSKMEG